MNSFSDLMAPPKNLSSILANRLVPPLVSLSKKQDLVAGIPDGILALISPIVVYWTYATFFHLIDVYHMAEKYRIHPSEEEESRNKATLHDVLVDVVLQHVIQTIVGGAIFYFDKTPTTGFELYDMWSLKQKLSFLPGPVIWLIYMYGFSCLKIVCAFVIMDTWQYALHRTMHESRWLYKRFHSRHHRLYVPYAYGALYNDPFEGFLLDTCGGGLSGLLMGLTPRESLVFYTISTMKTIDDHCGYRLPYDPFQVVFPNNSLYHDIHHQSWGFKHNYSQPFFTLWDRFLGTKYEFINEYKSMQEKITLEKYKMFLAEKTKNKYTKKDVKSADAKESKKDM